MKENELRNYIVNTAKTFLGATEGSAKHLDIVNTYNAIKPLPQGYKLKTTDSWCAATVSAMAAKCGLLDIIPAECSCPRQIALWQKMGRWMENDAYVPKPGDIIYYDWQDSGAGDNTGTPDHVGIVTKVDGNTITVIEGNAADTVKYRTLAVNGKYIRGYGLPDYASKATKEEKGMFKDTAGHPHEKQINRLAELGIVKGYADGTFEPDKPITRGEMAVMLTRLYDKFKEGK